MISHMNFLRNFLISVTCIFCFCLLYGCGTLKFSNAEKPNSPPSAPITKNKNLAIVLGGGGAKGLAHIGFLEELENAGIVPDLIVGCSAGSIVGALYASNPDAKALKSLVFASERADVISVSIKEWPYSVYDHHHLAKYLRLNIKHHDFRDLKIPLIVTATNLEFGNLTAFSTGDVIDPVLASAAAPGAFAPVKIDEQYFIDCGVANPVPVQIARDLGYKIVVAVNIAEQLPTTPPNHLLGVMKRSIEIAYINQCKYAMEGADIVVDFKFRDIGIFNEKHNLYLYQEGLNAGKKAVPQILTLLHR